MESYPPLTLLVTEIYPTGKWLWNSTTRTSQLTSELNRAEQNNPTNIWVFVLEASLTIMLTVGTVCGNFLVIFAVAREHRLRSKVTNLFIASLACADFLIGVVVLPFAIYDLLSGGYWIFGRQWCDLWHAFDVLGCTASITNLCVIAMDRFWAITQPMSYQKNISRKVGFMMIAAAWFCSALISFPCIAWWRAVEPALEQNVCIFSEDAFYLILSSCISFYIPSIIMITLYWRIYQTAIKQIRAFRNGKIEIHGRGKKGITMRVHHGASLKPQPNNNNNGKRSASRMNNEHKAARTLGIVMGVFIACWLPFFIVNVTAPICFECIPIPHVTFPVVTWLGYANSAINPIIYSFVSKSFQHAFAKTLCRYCCCKKSSGNRSGTFTRNGRSISGETTMTFYDPSDVKDSNLQTGNTPENKISPKLNL